MPGKKPSSGDKHINKPRNLIILDATSPLQFRFQRFGAPVTIEVHQTANEATWPGGALWDLGWCMAQLLAAEASGGEETITTMLTAKGKRQSMKRRVPQTVRLPSSCLGKNIQTVVELGCGVGLTGLVAAAALAPKVTILTDLRVVIEQVTCDNVERNTILKQKKRLVSKGGGAEVVAMPLCWGNTQDEERVLSYLGERAPDLLLIGDVAYQHKPGAPSHFDQLMSTILRLAGTDTLVMFGLRIRMPASVDLLDMFHENFEPIIPSIPVESIEPSLGQVKHNMSIHIFRKVRKIL